MKIFLVRHGRDSLAAGSLTELGITQIEKAVDTLMTLGLAIDATVVLTSPAQRAVESAKIISDGLRLSQPNEVRWLENGQSYENLTEYAGQNSRLQAIIAVSHMPNIESVIGGFGRSFGFRFDPWGMDNGATYVVDLDEKKIVRLI